MAYYGPYGAPYMGNPYGGYPYPVMQPIQPVQPMQQPAPPAPTPPAPQPTNHGMNLVKGREGADAFSVKVGDPPTVIFDSDAPTFWLKSADSSGISMREFAYTEVTADTSVPPLMAAKKTPEYATREEVQALAARLDAALGMAQQPRRRRPPEAAEEGIDDEQPGI